MDLAESNSRKNRAINKLATLLTRAVYRDVAVHWAERPIADGAELSLSNHFGGFSDGLVLIYASPRRPGIIARDVIWKIPIAGRLMSWIGGIPVHQPADGGASSNDQMFSSCYEALRTGRHVLIFPEGLTRDEPSIGRVKTGSARIALGARSSGVDNLAVTPIGIHYEDKAALRSRVVVNIGASIRLDEIANTLDPEGDAPTADNRPAVRALTDRFETELRRVAPDYTDWQEARRMRSAAEITLRTFSATGTVSFGIRDRLANVLADLPVENRDTISGAVENYETDLDAVDLSDAAFSHQLSSGSFVRALTAQLLVGLLLLPFALVGALINVVPFLIVKAIGLLRVSPAVLASVKPIAAFLVFGIAWGVELWGAAAAFGVVGLGAAIVLIPVYSITALAVFDRAVLLFRMFRRWRAGPRSEGIRDRLAAERATVVDEVLRR